VLRDNALGQKPTLTIVIYATRFCVNWVFLIAREARLKYERSEDVPKFPNLLKMISHLILTVLTNFSRNVTLNVLSRGTVGYLLFFALEQLGGSLQRRKMRIYDS
jgi:hypothetical protein